MPGMKTFSKHENRTLSSSNNQTLQIPTGGKLHSICLYFKTAAGAAATEAQIRAEIANLRLTVGGRDIVNAPVAKILDAYEALGSNVHNNVAVAGCVELNLGRLIYTDPGLRDLFGIGTMDVSSIQVQVQAGTLSGIASVESYTEREPVNEGMGTYCRFIDYQQSFNSTGDHTVDTLSRDPSTSYLALMVSTGASGVITQSAVKVGQVTLREDVPLNVNKLFLSNNRMEQPTGYFIHGFTDGTVTARLSMQGVPDMRIVTNFSTAPGAASYSVTALTVENFPVNLK